MFTDIAVETINAVATYRLQGFKDLVKDFSAEAVEIQQNGKPRTAQISLTTETGATKENPTEFEDTSTKVEAKPIVCTLLSQQFGKLWNDPITLEQIIAANMDKLCDTMMGKITALFTTTNFGALNQVDITGATTGDTKDELFQKIYALQSKGTKKILFANPTLYAKGAPVNQNSFDPTLGPGKVRGFDGFYEMGYLEGNAAKVCGVLTDGSGIGLISRIPQWDSMVSSELQTTTVTIDKLGLTVQLNKWGSTKTRAAHATLDVVFGAGVYDKTATKLIGDSGAAA